MNKIPNKPKYVVVMEWITWNVFVAWKKYCEQEFKKKDENAL